MIKSRHIVLLIVLLGIVLLAGYIIFNVFGDDETIVNYKKSYFKQNNNEGDNNQYNNSNKEIKNNKEIKEEWTNYVQSPFDYVKIGSDPINFYIKPTYRKPYGYPYKFRSSYPYDHYRYGSNN